VTRRLVTSSGHAEENKDGSAPKAANSSFFFILARGPSREIEANGISQNNGSTENSGDSAVAKPMRNLWIFGNSHAARATLIAYPICVEKSSDERNFGD
jgi:hypothetical protein